MPRLEVTFRRGIVLTRSVDFHLKTVNLKDNLNVSLQVLALPRLSWKFWDVGGQDRQSAFTHAYYRNADACVIVFDVCKLASLEVSLNFFAVSCGRGWASGRKTLIVASYGATAV